jgi:hypothetical protein
MTFTCWFAHALSRKAISSSRPNTSLPVTGNRAAEIFSGPSIPHAESGDERGSHNNLALRVRHYAVLGSRWIESRGKCGVFPHAQQQFGGPDDSANQQRGRPNSESFKELIAS